ncbi:autotransporter outer membrane beta-barrel domain-containing protein [Bartonella acomydis]|uniref:Autotransporter domain-containing protein n=1 Tax=Bartonella acomydis TaxID=686234 RepID=A0ABP9MVN8_9HYPH
MVNVSRDYKFLFITTAIVSFLPIVNINANPHNLGTSCEETESSYTCNDGKKHTIKDKTYHLKNSQDSSPNTMPRAAIFIEKAGTVVDASQITVYGDNSNKISAYGAVVQDGGALVLTDSNFKGVAGFSVQSAVVSMTDGVIEGIAHAIYASGKKTDVALVRVNIETKLNGLGDIGLISSFGAKIRMSGSSVTFNGSGAFSSQYGGQYTFDNTVIKGIGKQEAVIVDEGSINKLPEAFDVFQGGDIQLRNSSLQLSDMHGFWIKNSSGDVDDQGKLLWRGFDGSGTFKKTNIKIEESDISVQGERAHGLYFDGLHPDEWFDQFWIFTSDAENRLQERRVIRGKAFVQLSQTALKVPDGITIYSTGTDGYGAEAIVKLKEETNVSGDLLLKAENDSSLLVQAYHSTLTGGTRIKDTSRIDLHLMQSSKWYLTKSKKGLQESDFANSSLSTISLRDSTIVFDHYLSKGYQTLHIGRRSNTDKITLDEDEFVYSAEGNVQIKMSASPNDDGLFDPQKTDRILIYGNVFGSTLLKIEGFSKISEKEVGSKGNESISLVQVFGTAEEDSFKLSGNYVAIDGLPYQYHLRAYGPNSSRGVVQFENSLVEASGDFWDFRLEGVYISSPPNSSETLPVTPSSSEPSVPVKPILPDPEPTSPIPVPPSPSEPLEPVDTTSLDPELISPIPVPPSPSEPLEPVDTTSLDPELISPIPVPPSPSKPLEPVDPSSSDPEPTSPIPVPPSPSKPLEPVDPSSSDPEPASPIPVPPSPSKPLEPVDPSSSDPEPASPIPVPPSPSEPLEPVDPSFSDSVPVQSDIQQEFRIRAVVPQLPTYLLLPNALFQVGLMDLTVQNKKLENIRSAAGGLLKSDEISAFFVRGYGGSHHYTSNLSAFEYGYGAELDYTALEAGVLLKEIESLCSRTLLGVMGTYGSLSLFPQDVEYSKKSAFDKWSVAAYGNMQHNTGLYINGVFSYSLFRGDVFTLVRDKTATLKGKQFNTSLTGGTMLTLRHKSVVFDPQIQLLYQHLQFDHVHDVDNIDVDLGKFDQWIARFGGRLSKYLSSSEEGRVISFYSKLYLSYNFRERQFVSFKKDFQLGAFGSPLEVGLGFHARLSPKFALHGDITYQHRLTKAGFSGASFSAGLRHLF